MAPFTANEMYGGTPSPQPTATPVPGHAPGTPEPLAKTVKGPGGATWENPTLLLVVLLAVAFGLIRFSVRVGG